MMAGFELKTETRKDLTVNCHISDSINLAISLRKKKTKNKKKQKKKKKKKNNGSNGIFH